MPIPVLQHAELDALTEVCSIGMGHAATALSRLMGKGVDIRVPGLRVLDAAGLGELLDAQEVIGVHLRIVGNVRGGILILLREESARLMLDLLLGGRTAAVAPLSELEAATLMEIGNIVASACLNALGLMLKMPLLPSVPTLVSGEAGEVLAHAMNDPADGETVLMIETVFSVSEARCGGSIFLIPEPASLGAILTALGAP